MKHVHQRPLDLFGYAALDITVFFGGLLTAGGGRANPSDATSEESTICWCLWF